MSYELSAVDLLPITKEWILERVSEKEIMDHYLGRSYEYGEIFRSPFRNDRHPTCNLFVTDSNRVRYRDWSDTNTLDCFDVAQQRTHVRPFPALLTRIAVDMGLTKKRKKTTLELQEERDELFEKKRTQKAHIRVKLQDWTPTDRRYLDSYGLNNTTLLKKYQVYSPEIVWLHGELYYVWSHQNPALAYYFGKTKKGAERWKIYFYRNPNFRFLGNTSRIQGWVQLPEKHNLCVLTKSMKDVMCLSLYDIPAIAMQGELTIPYPRIIDELRERFANLYSLYDFDRAGVIAANKLRRLYDIEPLFLTDGRFNTRDFGSKDFSDFIRDHNEDDVKTLLREAVRHTGVKITLPFE